MRLTADVIMNCFARINPCLERELDLRGLKIPAIENVGATQVTAFHLYPQLGDKTLSYERELGFFSPTKQN
jgi:hypothetical protein